MGLDFDSLPFQAPASDHGGAGQNPGLVFGNPYSGKTTSPLELRDPCRHPFPPLSFCVSEMLMKTGLIVKTCWAEAEDPVERLPGREVLIEK